MNKDLFNKFFNTGNIKKDFYNYELYMRELNFNTDIKKEDIEKFKNLQNFMKK